VPEKVFSVGFGVIWKEVPVQSGLGNGVRPLETSGKGVSGGDSAPVHEHCSRGENFAGFKEKSLRPGGQAEGMSGSKTPGG
jgi:hypothetical protein